MLGLILLHTWRLHSSDFHSKGDFHVLPRHLPICWGGKKKKGPIRPRIWDPEMIAFKIYGKL